MSNRHVHGHGYVHAERGNEMMPLFKTSEFSQTISVNLDHPEL